MRNHISPISVSLINNTKIQDTLLNIYENVPNKKNKVDFKSNIGMFKVHRTFCIFNMNIYSSECERLNLNN